METDDPTDAQIGAVVEAVTNAGGLEYARERALAHATGAEAALDLLTPGPARDALRASIPYVLDRRS
jgi:geranylgeranyl pyrophosphate synthase